MNRKKYLILYVLKILEANTDFKHTMTQKQIAEWLSDVMPCDRKTVGRNIKALTEIGYPIIKTGSGYYLGGKKFGTEEIARFSGAEMRDYEESLKNLRDLGNVLDTAKEEGRKEGLKEA